MKGHIDLPENAGRVGTFTHDEAGTPVHIQPVVPANAETGEPLDLATEGTLAALGAAVATLNAAASAIKSAVEGLNGKATAINTGAVAGTVELGAASLAALENVTAMVANFPASQQVFGAVDADTGLMQPLTDAQLRGEAVAVSGTLALDAPTLAALETVNVGNFPAIQPVSAAALPLPANAATEPTLALVKTAVEAIVAALFNTGDVFTVGNNGIIALAKRRDADTATVGDGELTTLNMDEEGRLKVATKPASYAPVSGNITANGQNVSIPCGRFGNISVSMIATSLVGHNAIFECSNNSTNGTDGTWYNVQAARSNANTADTTTGVLAATPAYMWHVNVSEYSYFRMRATAHTSGTAAYILRPGSNATEPLPIVQVTGTQPVSFTQAALPAGTARMGFVAGSGIWFDDSSAVLAANATFTGTSRDLTVTATATAFANAATYAKELRVSAESDQAGTLWLEVSRDNVNWRRVKSVATAAVTGGGQYAEIVHRPSWRYARVGFTNGATLQTRFSIGSMAVAI